MIDRPDWITCIAHTHAEMEGTAWCGRSVRHAFYFVNIDHAAYNGQAEGRLIACPECLAAIMKALRHGHED